MKRKGFLVCVCSAVVLKAIYQDVMIMVRGLTVFSVFRPPPLPWQDTPEVKSSSLLCTPVLL